MTVLLALALAFSVPLGVLGYFVVDIKINSRLKSEGPARLQRDLEASVIVAIPRLPVCSSPQPSTYKEKTLSFRPRLLHRSTIEKSPQMDVQLYVYDLSKVHTLHAF